MKQPVGNLTRSSFGSVDDGYVLPIIGIQFCLLNSEL